MHLIGRGNDDLAGPRKGIFKGVFRTHQIGHERAWTVVRAMLKDRRVIQMKADAAKGTLDVTLAS